MTLYLDDDDVASLLPMEVAITSVERAFRLLSDGTALNEVRHRTHADGAVLNVMWALAPEVGVLGVKAYPVVRQDVTQGSELTVLLYSAQSGALLAVLKGDKLGQLRTGAASAVASRTLAREGAKTLTVFGTGYQALSQVLAHTASVPTLESVRVVGRSPARRDAFIDHVRDLVCVDVEAARPETAAASADIVVTATGSATPVLHGGRVKPGAHVNAIGSNTAAKRELDRTMLERCSVIAVDDPTVANQESGDLIANAWDPLAVVALGDILTARTTVRRGVDDITLFESHGLAVQDVVCAAVVYERALDAGRGRRIRQP
ncbi:MAG: ornithine cyclodeaminase family protein [Actinomycetota bacterium]|nr:ornithine cyclodeaminase family protein [Actinomycetota bacterium]